ncbi:hypothetical protein [Burkholderia gladioli]|uniref:hypothetical protein n=1 Tax=Burkholderia gladioli TaxID=28095 RepID=UPI0016418139|nr:hypothetical protein [Burkholderia gladioli]
MSPSNARPNMDPARANTSARHSPGHTAEPATTTTHFPAANRQKIPQSCSAIILARLAIHPTNSQNVTIEFLRGDLYFPTIHTKRIKWQTFAKTQHFCQVASRNLTTIPRGA